jgi:hypothetical protein
MQDDDFLGHLGGSGLGRRMVLLACLVAVLGGLGEAGGHIGKP